MTPTRRPRRLRRDGLRELVSETDVRASDLVAVLFVDATISNPEAIESMPGQQRIPVSEAASRAAEIEAMGIEAVLLFGIPRAKDEHGTRAWAEDGVVQRAARQIGANTDLTICTDVCLCEYTNHGHCGVLEAGATDDPELTVANDETLELLARTAVSHAEAGADVLAPSAAMDGMVGAVRSGLDDAGYQNRAILSYAAKYESALYGPFRDAADGAPSFGDRRHYQLDPGNAREAIREVALDVEEGCDMVMVKPALASLDVVRRVREQFDVPVAAYSVSGEYAMIQAAADCGWLDREAVALELLQAIERAGAEFVVTYFATELAPVLEG